jgi:hypothetical protein
MSLRPVPASSNPVRVRRMCAGIDHMHAPINSVRQNTYIYLCRLRVGQQHIQISSVVRLEPLRAECCCTERTSNCQRIPCLKARNTQQKALLFRRLKHFSRIRGCYLHATGCAAAAQCEHTALLTCKHTHTHLATHRRTTFAMETATKLLLGQGVSFAKIPMPRRTGGFVYFLCPLHCSNNGEDIAKLEKSRSCVLHSSPTAQCSISLASRASWRSLFR